MSFTTCSKFVFKKLALGFHLNKETEQVLLSHIFMTLDLDNAINIGRVLYKRIQDLTALQRS